MPDNIRCNQVRDLFPGRTLALLREVAASQPSGVYLVGGTVRDLLLGRRPADLDLTVCCHAQTWARAFARACDGTFVELGRDEDAARVVYQGESIDFSSFRAGAVTIDQELGLRDLRINAMAVALDPLLVDPAGAPDDQQLPLIDPLAGRDDLARRRIRLCSPRAILDDPLRLVRVFRFAASLDFTIDQETLAQVRSRADRIERVAVERVSHELDLIMATPRAHAAFAAMAGTGLLFAIIPELLPGVGMEQPASHHLDVFAHLLEALRQMERIMADPERFYPGRDEFRSWLARRRMRRLKWAALLHDVGKPATYGINEDKGGRITFYYHDHRGAELVKEIGARLRWPLEDTEQVSHLVRLHMRPFFLANDQRQNRLTLKACLRLVREAGEALPGLFLVAMADALAGKGEGSPEQMEQELAELFARLNQVWRERVRPVQNARPLLTGHDLMDELGMEPGPFMGKILTRLQHARMEGTITTRGEALVLAEGYIREMRQDRAGNEEQ